MPIIEWRKPETRILRNESVAGLLADLPQADRNYFLQSLSEEEALRAIYTWELWARPNQLAPPGNWRTLLVLAGRGFGKSRLAAEWIRQRQESGKYGRFALVGRSAADVRDVIVQGESGLINISPPWNRPVYSSSKRRVEWPNGAYAILFSAEEPDQLRGPQHDTALCDEIACLVPGTMIQTQKGAIPIEKVKVGDFVPTRRGLRRVDNVWMNNPSAEVWKLTTTNGELIGTGHHRVWTENRGWQELSSLRHGDILKIWNQQKLSQQNPSRVSSGTTNVGGSMAATTATVEEACSIEPSMQTPMDRSMMGLKSIIETRTRLITTYPTSKPYLKQTIEEGIEKGGQNGQPKRDNKLLGSSGSFASPIAIIVTNAARSLLLQELGLGSVGLTAMQQMSVATAANSWTESANIAISHLDQSKRAPNIALWHASMVVACNQNKHTHARSVESNSGRMILEPYAAPENAEQSTVGVVRIEKLSDRSPVYDLSVEDCHEYFANGILVHNSWKYPDAWDQLQFGLRLGLDPRTIVTTTPRPTKFIRELASDKNTRVITGSTYENLANLAPAFADQIIKKYQGTRLGRQEIEGMILEDIQGSLWKMGMFDVRRYPLTLRRVVVGVDPSTEEEGRGAEAGIIVAAIDDDKIGYILADKTIRAGPNGWAQAAVDAYDQYKADVIVAEKNNGGAMVEALMRTIRPNLSYKGVVASRGKQPRAEPIVSLYEQKKVYHVEEFTTLEEQLTTWTPNDSNSPDRLDALVWALTELMIEPADPKELKAIGYGSARGYWANPALGSY